MTADSHQILHSGRVRSSRRQDFSLIWNVILFSQIHKKLRKRRSADNTLVHNFYSNSFSRFCAVILLTDSGEVIGKGDIQIDSNLRLYSLSGHPGATKAHLFLCCKYSIEVCTLPLLSLQRLQKDIYRDSVIQRLGSYKIIHTDQLPVSSDNGSDTNMFCYPATWQLLCHLSFSTPCLGL